MKENKNKILSLRVTQEEYDTIELLSMMYDISITNILRESIQFLLNCPFKKQEELCRIINKKR